MLMLHSVPPAANGKTLHSAAQNQVLLLFSKKIGEFKVENVPFSIKTGEEAGNWALGYGTSTAVGAFELISIEFFADTTLVGTWTKDKWTPEVVAPTKYARMLLKHSCRVKNTQFSRQA